MREFAERILCATTLEEKLIDPPGGRLTDERPGPAWNFAAEPGRILRVWEGGMSFHGGMLGVILAMVAYARSRGRRWLEVTDLIAPCVPTGLAMGRIGNFINI